MSATEEIESIVYEINTDCNEDLNVSTRRLPPGVTASLVNNLLIIGGTPNENVSGTFLYEVYLDNGVAPTETTPGIDPIAKISVWGKIIVGAESFECTEVSVILRDGDKEQIISLGESIEPIIFEIETNCSMDELYIRDYLPEGVIVEQIEESGLYQISGTPISVGSDLGGILVTDRLDSYFGNVFSDDLFSIMYTLITILPDNNAPIIKLNGSAVVSLSYGESYQELGATASDTIDGDLTNSILTQGFVDSDSLGEYVINYSVSDSSSNTASVTRTIYVVDITNPTIELNGASTVTLTIGETWTDPGATASDNVDGNLTDSISINGEVDTTSLGNYQLIYSVSDTSSNTSSVIRLVTITEVPDTDNPVLTLNGTSTIILSIGDNYVDLGATATDDVDGDLTSSIAVSGAVDTSSVGTYTLTYTVEDSTGNTSTIDRIIVVVDNSAPVITLNGSDTVSLTVGETWTDPGATATDNVDGDLTSSITVSGTVDVNSVGTYSVSYIVFDTAGNSSSINRTVYVNAPVDNQPPDIVLSGDSTMVLTIGDTFTDPGATATDNFDGDLTSSITVSGTVDTSTVGTYTLTYTAVDAGGNSSNVIRTVIVQSAPDTTPPTISLNGDTTINISVGDNWTDPGATASDNLDGNLTNSIIVNGNVNPSIAGTYNINYTVTDSAGNSSSAVRVIIVTEIACNITTTLISGSYNQSLSPGETMSPIEIRITSDCATITNSAMLYNPGDSSGVNPGADGLPPGVYMDTTEYQNGELTLTLSGTIRSDALGSYPWGYIFDNSYFLPATPQDPSPMVAATTSVTISGEFTIAASSTTNTNTTPPTISLNGSSTIELTVGDNWTDPGATATPGSNGDVSDVSVAGSVDTDTAGSYILTYSVTSALSGYSASVTRTVIVQPIADTTPPVITLNGSSTVELTVGDTWADPGANAMDDVDGDLTSSIVVNGVVDTSSVGTYTLAYSVADAAGNSVNTPRFVIVNAEQSDRIYFENGTCKCPDASVGETATISGTTYTVVDNSTIKGEVDNGNINLCTTSVTNMDNLFSDKQNFNSDISFWDVENVNSMEWMFEEARAFNQDIGIWNTSNVISMYRMFDNARAFNQNIGGWDTSNVTDMYYMFASAINFNQDISGWDVSSVVNMGGLFRYANSFNQDISNWDVSNVTNMKGMFQINQSFNIDIGNWDVSSVTNMVQMFDQSESFDQDLSNWCVTNITSEPYEFSTNSALLNPNKPVWGTCPSDDITLPVITLNGSPTIQLTVGETWTDPGANAMDDVDGDITNSIAISGSVDASTVGTYTLVYSVVDSASNSASTTRTVIVAEADCTITYTQNATSFTTTETTQNFSPSNTVFTLDEICTDNDPYLEYVAGLPSGLTVELNYFPGDGIVAPNWSGVISGTAEEGTEG